MDFQPSLSWYLAGTLQELSCRREAADRELPQCSPTTNRSQPPVFSLSRHRIPTPLALRPSIRSVLARPLTSAEPQKKKEITNESQESQVAHSKGSLPLALLSWSIVQLETATITPSVFFATTAVSFRLTRVPGDLRFTISTYLHHNHDRPPRMAGDTEEAYSGG